MAKDDKFYMPSSGAGILRYYDEEKSRVQLKPEHVIALCIITGVIVIVLHLIGGA